MRQTKERKGFTLIELLIVVAIIAILAAIAIPNFLEAQVRAKVARVKNDLRTLAVAEEAYYVDWNSYTFRDSANSWALMQGWKQLTTPVAYTTTIPRAPFGDSRNNPAGGGPPTATYEPMYELGTGSQDGPSGTVTAPNLANMPASMFEIDCDGPDKVDDTGSAPWHTYSWSNTNFPWNPPNPDSAATVSEALTLIYDPTNGTISTGDILRFGGQKKPGACFDVLWNNASK